MRSPLDPRTKLFIGVMAITAVLISERPSTLVVESFLLLMGVFLFGVAESWRRSLPLILPMLGLVFVISFLSYDLSLALLLALRLLNLLTVSFVFFQKITPEEVGDAMRKLGIPYEWSFIMTTSMRYVPLISRRIRQIVDAQRSRGIDLRPRLRNVPNFMALLMPLLVQSFLLSEELAMAMESRGFSSKGRSFRKEYRIAPWEFVFMILCLVSTIVLAYWEKG
jgi:energy-coupling factor transport system permease protein